MHSSATTSASSSPGHGGMKGCDGGERRAGACPELEPVPASMVRQRRGTSAAMSSRPPADRHIFPRPDRMNQISLTVRCRTARDACSGGQPEMRHAAALDGQQSAHLRTVRGDRVVASGSIIDGKIDRALRSDRRRGRVNAPQDVPLLTAARRRTRVVAGHDPTHRQL